MIPNFKFKSIEIFSDNLWKKKQIFFWKFKKINFLFWKNDSWKTTFFHIFKDILWNPNVAWNNTSWRNILTEDLANKKLEAILYFYIWDKLFYTIKEYKIKTRQLFYLENWDFIGSFNSFLIYIEEENILILPKVIFWWKNKITLNSLMRLCFIEQSHFWKNFKVEKHKSCNIIIKHYNDWRTKVLFYLYLLNIITKWDKLTEYYLELWKFSKADNELESVNKQIKTLTDDKYIDLNTWLFDDKILIKKIKELENKKRKIILNNFNFKDILGNFYEIYNFNKKIDKNIKNYLELLNNDLNFIKSRIESNNKKILTIEKDILKHKNQIEEIDKMLILHLLENLEFLEWDNKSLLKNLSKNKEVLKIEIEEYKEYYWNIIKILEDSEEFNLLQKFVNEFTKNIDLKLGLEINLSTWKYTINTTSDSINRIVLFNILLSFIFLKEKILLNHLWFIVFDSPFAWLDKKKEINAINNFIENLDIYWFNWQVFIFLNPDEINSSDLNFEPDDISIKESIWKVFSF